MSYEQFSRELYDTQAARFLPITAYGKREHGDAIDDRALREREQIDVLWPNGKCTRHRVAIICTMARSMPGQELPTTQAFVLFNVNGATIDVRLYGSGCKARRVKYTSNHGPRYLPRGNHSNDGATANA